jgi:hypothetical protein
MENNIPTAEEFLKRENLPTNILSGDDVNYAMIEFAKMHVQEALKEASEKVRQIEDPYAYTGNTGSEYPADYIVDKDSILNAYPLTLIK